MNKGRPKDGLFMYITNSRIRVFLWLKKHVIEGGHTKVTVKDVAYDAQVSLASITRILKHLTEWGWLEEEVTRPTGPPRIHYKLTPKGKRNILKALRENYALAKKLE